MAINRNGREIGMALKRGFRQGEIVCFYPSSGGLKDLTGRIFDKDKFEGIIFIMALGIVMRMIAPYLRDKYRDPAIVAVDDERRFAVSALSGHEGGANVLALKAANILGAEPVITTASESRKKIVIGLGCRRGIRKEEIIKAVKYGLEEAGSSLKNLRFVSTVDLKDNEIGLRQACFSLGIGLRIIPLELIKRFNGAYQKSAFVKEKIGVEGVCEPCALIAARKPKLILPKTKIGRVTVAVAREA